MSKNTTILILSIALIVLIVAGAYTFLNKDVSETNLEGDVDSVTVRLKWLHQTQFAGHYVADQKGIYRNHGIEVTLKSFDFKNWPIDEVVTGVVDFGVTGADELLLARTKGQPIKAVAVIYQKSPVTAYALKESGIDSPDDFIGKRVGIQSDSNVEYQIHAMLNAVGVDYNSDIETIPIGFDETELINGEVDVASGYITNEPIQAEERGYEVNIIHPLDYGIDVYADVIFASEDMIKNNPDLVQRFVSATLEGWEYALQHQDEAVQSTLLYEDPNNDALNFDHQKRLLEASAPLIKPSASAVVGKMNFVKWKKSYDLMRRYGLIDGDFDVRDAYSMQFLP